MNNRATLIRLSYELLSSLNIAWAFEWYDRQRGRPGLFPWVDNSPFLKRLSALVGMNEPGTVLEQIVWSVALALLLFLLFRLLALLSPARLLLSTIAGIVAVICFPVFYLCTIPNSLFGMGIGSHRPWSWLEITAAIALCALYYLGKIPSITGVFLLILHFGFWGWVVGSWQGLVLVRAYAFWTPAFWVVALFYVGFPLLGFLSSLAWGKYLNESSPSFTAA